MVVSLRISSSLVPPGLTTLTSSPTSLLSRARPMRSMIAPKNQPIARVPVISLDYFVHGGELADLQFFGSARAYDLDLVTHFLVEQGAADAVDDRTKEPADRTRTCHIARLFRA